MGCNIFYFIPFQEVPKTPDHVPARTFYLFSVNLEQVARMLLDRSHKVQWFTVTTDYAQFVTV